MTSLKHGLLAAAVTTALTASALAGVAQAQGPVGDWELTVTTPQGPNTANLSLKQAPEGVTGELSSQLGVLPVKGTVTGDTVALTAAIAFQGNNMELGLNGKLEGEALNGTLKFGDFGEFPFTGKRTVKAAAAAPAAPVAGSLDSATGKWNVVFTIEGLGQLPVSANLTQEGEKVTGTIVGPGGELPIVGTMTGRTLKLDFKIVTPQGELPVAMTGDLSETGLAGKATIPGMAEASWTGTRVQ